MATGINVDMVNPPTLPLCDRVAIVIGGSCGISRAIASHLCSLSAWVVINYDSSLAQVNTVAAELNSSDSDPSVPPRTIAVKADIFEPDQIKHLFDEAERAFESPTHIFVNYAGVADPKDPILADTTVEDWDSTFKVNTRGAFLRCQEAANRLRCGGGGRIVMVTTSLIGGLFLGYSAYTALKAAVETVTKIAMKELKGDRD